MKKLLAWSAVHFVVTLLLLLLSPHAMDDDPPGVLGQGAGLAAKVLIQPGVSVWSWIGDRNDFLEWAVLFGNSMLWGAMLMRLQMLLSTRRRR